MIIFLGRRFDDRKGLSRRQGGIGIFETSSSVSLVPTSPEAGSYIDGDLLLVKIHCQQRRFLVDFWWTEDEIHALPWEKDPGRADAVLITLRLDRNPTIQLDELERLPVKGQCEPC